MKRGALMPTSCFGPQRQRLVGVKVSRDLTEPCWATRSGKRTLIWRIFAMVLMVNNFAGYVNRSEGVLVDVSGASNSRFERSRGSIFVGPRSGSMIGINRLRSTVTQPRVAQPDR